MVSAVLAVGALATLAWLALAHGTERLAVLDAIAAGADDPSLPAVARARSGSSTAPPGAAGRGLRAHADAGRRGALPPGSRRSSGRATTPRSRTSSSDLAALVARGAARARARPRGVELLLVDGVSSPLSPPTRRCAPELARIGELLGPRRPTREVRVRCRA